MARWFAALILSLLLVGHGAAAFAGDEGGDPGRGHHYGSRNSQNEHDSNGDLHSGH